MCNPSFNFFPSILILAWEIFAINQQLLIAMNLNSYFNTFVNIIILKRYLYHLEFSTKYTFKRECCLLIQLFRIPSLELVKYRFHRFKPVPHLYLSPFSPPHPTPNFQISTLKHNNVVLSKPQKTYRSKRFGDAFSRIFYKLIFGKEINLFFINIEENLGLRQRVCLFASLWASTSRDFKIRCFSL